MMKGCFLIYITCIVVISLTLLVQSYAFRNSVLKMAPYSSVTDTRPPGTGTGARPTTIPHHVAFIVDGNGRWAVEQGLPRFEGHSKGANTTVEVAKHLFSGGVSVITFYLFSTENWSRPPTEVANIMSLLEKYLVDVSAYLLENKIRLNVIGQLDRLPGSSQALIKALEMSTEGFIKDEEGGKTLCLALSYGGRDDIVTACKKINASGLSPEDISEETFNSYLSLGSRGIPDPDLVIRTSGEQRLSNFLLWQSAYSEFVYLDTLWPDLTVDECCEVLREYGSRERRFGGEASTV